MAHEEEFQIIHTGPLLSQRWGVAPHSLSVFYLYWWSFKEYDISLHSDNHYLNLMIKINIHSTVMLIWCDENDQNSPLCSSSKKITITPGYSYEKHQDNPTEGHSCKYLTSTAGQDHLKQGKLEKRL